MDLGVSLRKINNIFNTMLGQKGPLSLWFLSRFFFIMHFSDRPETIPFVFRIWLLNVKSIQQVQLNPKQYTQRRWFFSYNSWKRPISFSKWLVLQWSRLVVLSWLEKHPESTWTLFVKARTKTLTLFRPGGRLFEALAKKMNKLNWQFRLYDT